MPRFKLKIKGETPRVVARMMALPRGFKLKETRLGDLMLNMRRSGRLENATPAEQVHFKDDPGVHVKYKFTPTAGAADVPFTQVMKKRAQELLRSKTASGTTPQKATIKIDNTDVTGDFDTLVDHAADAPMYVGTYSDRNVGGMYMPSTGAAVIFPKSDFVQPVSTRVHEGISHRTDDALLLIRMDQPSWLPDWIRPGSTTAAHEMPIYDAYRQIASNISPFLSAEGKRIKADTPYELRATNLEFSNGVYNQLAEKVEKKTGSPVTDYTSLDTMFNNYIDSLTPQQLAQRYSYINGYGRSYAEAIKNAKSGLSDANYNAFIKLLKDGLKALPMVTAGVVAANSLPDYKHGGGIHIKKKNKGKFTDYCGGKVTQNCINRAKASGNPTLVKRAVFAENARRWRK